MAKAADIVSPGNQLFGHNVDESPAPVHLVMIFSDLESIVLRLPTLASRLPF